MIRCRYVFEGRVQHVGFRYTAGRLARAYGLTGWVRNEFDGSVTLVLQGEGRYINAVLEELMNDHYIRIDHYEVEKEEVIPEEKAFSVTR